MAGSTGLDTARALAALQLGSLPIEDSLQSMAGLDLSMSTHTQILAGQGDEVGLIANPSAGTPDEMSESGALLLA